MNLPPRYNKLLQRAYPDCRMRWSAAKEEWLLERKAFYRRLDIDPAHYPPHALDTFIQHRDGYYTAGSFPPEQLPPADKLVAFLQAMDPVKLGFGPDSGDALAVQIEEIESQKQQAKYDSIKREFAENGADELWSANAVKSYVPRVYDGRDRGSMIAGKRQ